MKDTPPFAVCSSAAGVLSRLAHGLSPGQSLELDDESGVHAPLVVEFHCESPAGSLFLLAHYHSTRGGRVPDPAVALFNTGKGEWIPLSVETPFARIAAAEFDGKGVRILLPDEHRQLLKLVEVWMRNVASNLLKGDPYGPFREEGVCSFGAYAAE